MIRFLSILISALAVLAAACAEEPRRKQPDGGRPNLLLISVDTLRADHLDLYGYPRATAPNLARFAAEGIVFERAWSQAPWTLPSLASLHTSLYPSQHGAMLRESLISEEVVTIAEVLRDAGYRTAAVSSHVFAGSRRGFAQGFDRFDESQIRGHDAVTSSAINGVATEILEDFSRAEPAAPFFLWLHYFDPHFSYVRHPEFGFANSYSGRLGSRIKAGRLKGLQVSGNLTEEDREFAAAVYDEEIAHLDAAIGDLLGTLARLGLADDTVIVVTADHGEAFLERGRFFHGKDVYEELIHVPLVIGGAVPDSLRRSRVVRRVEVASVPATLSAIAGVEGSHFQGSSLLAVALPGATPLPVFSEGCFAGGESDRKVAVAAGDWKLIMRLDDGGYELYDLATDPGERHDRFDDRDDRVLRVRGDLLAELERFLALPAAASGSLELSEEQTRHLRELGYVE